MFAAEMGCFMVVSIPALIVIMFIVRHFFPQLNIVQVGAISIFIWAVIYKILEMIFGKGSFD